MSVSEKVSAQAAFGAIAGMDIDPTVKAGRYPFQRLAERNILADVLPKLDLKPHHRLLDIGCGSGVLLVPLSYCVSEIVGIDHPDVVAALGDAHKIANATLVGGPFPETPLPGEFDRIMAYSVIPCMPDYETVLSFAEAAARMLPPGGRLLLGDIPNRDRQQRMKSGQGGSEFEAEWAKQRELTVDIPGFAEAQKELALAQQVGPIGDKQMMDLLLHLRSLGFDAWIMPQSQSLPFGRTREDIVVVRP